MENLTSYFVHPDATAMKEAINNELKAERPTNLFGYWQRTPDCASSDCNDKIREETSEWFNKHVFNRKNILKLAETIIEKYPDTPFDIYTYYSFCGRIDGEMIPACAEVHIPVFKYTLN